ncbi:MAG: Hpt domain-containing protein [Clostridiales Family XIII bacterium]|jgi:chemotaxis protein histidine kinase CheA|nr:Hpt domain-containing protein [Clostridiales Family XIII bacterium]
MSDDFNSDSMLELYLFESTGLLDSLDAMLLKAESERKLTQENINEIFRIMHTIKGSSAMMNFSLVSEIAHKTEDLFAIIRDNGPDEANFDELFDTALRVSDFLEKEVEKIQNGEELSENNPALTDEIVALTEKIKAETPNASEKPNLGRVLGGAPTPVAGTDAASEPKPVKNPEPVATRKPEPAEKSEPVATREPDPVEQIPSDADFSDTPVAPEGGRILGLEPHNASPAQKAATSTGSKTVGRIVVESTKKPNSLATYNIHIHFNEGARMENIRAYMLVNKLNEMGTVNRTVPDNLESNAEAADYIVENGFYVNFTTSMFREQIETVAKGTLSVESVSFTRRMPDESAQTPDISSDGGISGRFEQFSRDGSEEDFHAEIRSPDPDDDFPDEALHSNIDGDFRARQGSIPSSESIGEGKAQAGEAPTVLRARFDARETAAQAIAMSSSSKPRRKANRIVSAGMHPSSSGEREIRREPAAQEPIERPDAAQIAATPVREEKSASAPTIVSTTGETKSARDQESSIPFEAGAVGKPLRQNIISVDLTKLDSLLDLVGEIVINESMVTENSDLDGVD